LPSPSPSSNTWSHQPESYGPSCTERSDPISVGQGIGDRQVAQIVDVLFTLPPIPQPLNPRAKAVRKESRKRIALRFVEFKPEQQEMFQDFIAERVKL
jgi:hypothetical protein